ncbi:NAD(P)H-dependent glycerol-3-phosphate dehydrogenase [Sodalinema gerasimenkoae]|uniref:NAD(P)H-dependent glycerol-3-phosphate dehydrogenase n=1 Tax=Sodalinema gerasimenkoae TaxID=2862348 RepID=UPI00135AB88E|nr:NAD(P)H-dependent glycerol-3-phosphate dehydrogenase [Sodalinema gerasimenkoae]MCC5896889.1 NAD(P)H-dependent glycerol-3-phosphate dehydrogenase [Phormidium sp. BM_Day4_Bin.17]TVR13609.1 MAG: NAD(P)H-dependent glycerol-3-phosphate dehydrogenase [Phormidium sp. GEM2.Bin31]UCJ12967.1 MAG: NAD(P)H-dependent glycerol-3-phosphate dehydrogenase [Phormidium sp. PBR-2020]
MTKQITILGTGAWGTALGKLAEYGDNQVQFWSRRGDVSLEAAIANADVLLSAISMKGVGETASKLQKIGLPPKTIIVTATKGLEPSTTRTPSQIWQEAFPDHPVVVLSGPNLSKEIDKELPAATIAASRDIKAAETIQEAYSSDIFRVYTNTDPIGTELGGTLKNVMAIASGVCDGLDLGINAKSALLTRALIEIVRVGTSMGAEAETFWGLAGLGDLLATCNSSLSRNYRVGFGLSQHKTLEQVLEEIQSTAEGVNTTNVLIDLAKRQGIEVPISYQVYRLLNNQITPEEAVAALMERDLKPEVITPEED